MSAKPETELADKLKALREPFEAHQISKLPKPTKADAVKGNCRECGGYHGLPAIHLDYVGHAALTDRLLDVDPLWTWEPLALTAEGLPLLDKDGGLWIKLTICGITRLGYGDAQGKTGPNATKERIGDALRNAGMRFGLALDLWHKGELHQDKEENPLKVVDGGQQAHPTATTEDHGEYVPERTIRPYDLQPDESEEDWNARLTAAMKERVAKFWMKGPSSVAAMLAGKGKADVTYADYADALEKTDAEWQECKDKYFPAKVETPMPPTNAEVAQTLKAIVG